MAFRKAALSRCFICSHLSRPLSCAGALRTVCAVLRAAGGRMHLSNMRILLHTQAEAHRLSPSRVAFRRWWDRYERTGASLAAEADRHDGRPAIRLPTLVIRSMGGLSVLVSLRLPSGAHSRRVGSNSPELITCRLLAPTEWRSPTRSATSLIGANAPVAAATVLASVLFTDIVESTRKSPQSRPLSRARGACVKGAPASSASSWSLTERQRVWG